MKIFFSLIIIVIMSSCSNENSDEPHEASPKENIQISDENNSNLDDEDSNPDGDNSVSSQENKTPVEIIKDERNGLIPDRIVIPAINVDADVLHLGLEENGEMSVPESIHETSWFEPGYSVGAPGNSVIAGHVDDQVTPGVFYDLHLLEPGDVIEVYDENNNMLTFEVVDKSLYNADDAPVDKIFGYSHRSNLNLITCEGPWIDELEGTPNRWVVYSELIE